MATTKIWSIKGRLGPVIQYAENPEKTRNQHFTAQDCSQMRDLMDYACDDFKTEQQFYVTGINCDSAFAREQMIETKQRWQKTDGNVCYHAYQSFAPGEVTAEQAHQIGVELAQKLWGERFEIVVATHLNTRCYHNHFVLNSVSFMDGLKYNDCKATYRLLRETSDELCRQNRLSVIENPQRGKTKPYAEWRDEQVGKPTVRSLIRADIDRAIDRVRTLSQLWDLLEKAGYEIKLRVKYPALKPPGHTRFFRLRNLGDEYLPDALVRRIWGKRSHTAPSPKQRIGQFILRGNFKAARRPKGFRALYIEYLYLLRIRPQQQASAKRALFLLREDISKLDRLSRQCKLLCANRIDTAEQLALYKSNTQNKLDSIARQRDSLRTRKGDETAKPCITALTAQMRSLRTELRLCGEILQRAAKMKENLRTARKQEQDRREKQKYEQYQRRGGTSRETDLGGR